MHIVVLGKVVPDYEVPSSDFELVNNRAQERYTRMIGLYDENAIELGVQIKEKFSAALTLVSYGMADDIPILRKGIAMGAEKLMLVLGSSNDPFVIASNLKSAIEKLGDVDLVLSGQQSADMDRGVVHSILAQMLGLPFIPQVSNVQVENGVYKLNQIVETGSRTLEISGRAVLSITSVPENVPRIPAVRAIFAAKKKPVEKIEEIDASAMGIEEISVEIPKVESLCEVLPIDDMDDAAKLLIQKLREERYL